MSLLDDIARGPAAPQPLAQIGQVQDLQGQQQIQAARGIQMQGAQTENKLKSLALAGQQQGAQDQSDYRAAMAAAVDPNTGQVDRPTLLSTLAKLNPTAAAQTASSLSAQDTAAAEAKAKLQESQLKAAQTHITTVDQLLQNVTDPVSYANAMNIAQGMGIDTSKFPKQYDPAFVAQTHAQVLTTKDQLEQHMKQQGIDIDQQKADETGRHNAADEANAAATAAQTAKYEQGELGVKQGELALNRQKASTEQGQSIEALAQQVAAGEVKKPTVTRNNPFNEAVINRAYEINPKLNDSLYTMTQDLRSTKPNSMGGNVTRLGTAILHADNALDASKNLGTATGLPTAARASYNEAANFLTGEVGQFVTGGKLTVDEGKKIQDDLQSHFQGTRDAALNKIVELSGGKLKAQMEQYKNATQNEFPTDRVFNDPDIKASLVKHGILNASASGKVVVTAPDGSQHPFENQAQADKFKALAGIK